MIFTYLLKQNKIDTLSSHRGIYFKVRPVSRGTTLTELLSQSQKRKASHIQPFQHNPEGGSYQSANKTYTSARRYNLKNSFITIYTNLGQILKI